MQGNLDKIKDAALEAAAQDHIKAEASDLDKAQAMRHVMESEGGELLLDALRADCSSFLGAIRPS